MSHEFDLANTPKVFCKIFFINRVFSRTICGFFTGMSYRIMNNHCPLCDSEDAPEYFSDSSRIYFNCRTCGLIFVPSRYFPSRAEEKARYDLHQNSLDNAGYRAYLERLFVPMNGMLSPRSRGLDFGCGPGRPGLSLLFEQAGHVMAVYDPYYAPDEDALTRKYDFISATEVVEHLHEPGRTLDMLWRLLLPGGTLGIMTQMFPGVKEQFAKWHYRSDFTHVCFFARTTFEWLARKWGIESVFIGNEVIIMRNNGGQA